MELNLKLEIENLYGGDGNIRYIDVKETKLSRTKKKTTTTRDTGVAVDRSTDELKTEIKKEDVQTFAMEGKYPTMQFGGIHGKFWGHLKAAGKMITDMGDDDFPYKTTVDRMMMAVNISPVISVIKNFDTMKIGIIPMKLNTPGLSMRFFKVDYIPKCTVNLTLVYPDIYHKKILKMLKQAEIIAGLNKRRATIKVLNREIFGEGRNASPIND